MTFVLDYHGFTDVMRPAEPFFYRELAAGRLHVLAADISTPGQTATEIHLLMQERCSTVCRLIVILPLTGDAATFNPDVTVSNRLWSIRNQVIGQLKNRGYEVQPGLAIVADFVIGRESLTGRPCADDDASCKLWELDTLGMTSSFTDFPFLFSQTDVELIGADWCDIPILDGNDHADWRLEQLRSSDDHYILGQKIESVKSAFITLVTKKRKSLSITTAAESAPSIYMEKARLEQVASAFIGDLERRKRDDTIQTLVSYSPVNELGCVLAREYGILHDEHFTLLHFPLRLKPDIYYCRDSFRLALFLALAVSDMETVSEFYGGREQLYTIAVSEQKERMNEVFSAWIVRLKRNGEELARKAEELQFGRYDRIYTSDCTVVATLDEQKNPLPEMPSAPYFLPAGGGLDETFKIWMGKAEALGGRLTAESESILEDARKKTFAKDRKREMTSSIGLKEEREKLGNEYKEAYEAVLRLRAAFAPPSWECAAITTSRKELESAASRRPRKRAGWRTLAVAVLAAAFPWAGGAMPQALLYPLLHSVVPILTLAVVCGAFWLIIYLRKRKVDEAAEGLKKAVQVWLSGIVASFSEGKEFLGAICKLETLRQNVESLERVYESNMGKLSMLDAHKKLVASHLDKAETVMSWFELTQESGAETYSYGLNEIDYECSVVENVAVYVPTPLRKDVTPIKINVWQRASSFQSSILDGMISLELKPVASVHFGAREPGRGTL